MKKLVAIVFIVTAVSSYVGHALAANVDPNADPPRYISNCPYGDSMTPEVCAKFEQPAPQPEPVQSTPEPTSTDESWGK